MTHLNSFREEAISSLSKKDLKLLVMKAASMSKQFNNYLLVNYIDKEYGERDLFEIAKADLDVLFGKSYKGTSKELRLANMLAACSKRITEFSKTCKDHSLQMDLIMGVLRIPFSLSPNYYGTCFTKFNYQVYLLVKKAITLLKTKLHEDYHLQYTHEINRYLTFLHDHSSHLDYVYAMAKKV